MNAPASARAIARRELTSAITTQARRQIAQHGADTLSLRAIARELGMASSALYRYFPSRDDLLTALIIDTYNNLADALETADSDLDEADFNGRWLAVCAAARSWAKQHPHEYALVYGSPVPGYQAPPDTVDPASRIPLALFRPLRDAWRAGLSTGADPRSATPLLAGQLAALSAALAPGLPPEPLVGAISAWCHLFGMISFELFGHLVGSVDPADEFFEYEISGMAARLGLSAR